MKADSQTCLMLGANCSPVLRSDLQGAGVPERLSNIFPPTFRTAAGSNKRGPALNGFDLHRHKAFGIAGGVGKTSVCRHTKSLTRISRKRSFGVIACHKWGRANLVAIR